MPLYPSARICSSGWVQEKISEYTDISRTRRAISCVYWPPKSRTAILSGARMRRPALPGRPSFWACWKTFPSVLIVGAMISSVS